jgi:cation diffusion facilitator CzcD-associated flavoprotein CzcO
MTPVAIVGAGPYALSLAAHLRGAGIDFRIFGRPMSVWRERMPRGMLLKSDGCASNLDDPARAFTLRRYCEARGLPYQDRGLPVALETFIDYALDFQKQCVPDLDPREIEKLEPQPGGGFLVHPSGAAPVAAARVVVAAGISHFEHVPPVFARLPPDSVSHSSEHTEFSAFAGRDVMVVGAGASALDVAAALHGAGAKVVLVCRRKVIDFIAPPRDVPAPLEWLVGPPTDIGPGWKNVFCTSMPLAFHFMPGPFRREVVRRHLGPAPGWFSRAQTEGRFPFVLGATPVAAVEDESRVRVTLAIAGGGSRSLECDHVIAATGYRVDLARLAFLGDGLRAAIVAPHGSPRLSGNFESSVAGLYFTGLAAAESFGPLLRFACGSRFASAHLARHLLRTLRPRAASLEVEPL